MSGGDVGAAEAAQDSRGVVWCRPAEWPAAVAGEACLDDRVLVEKKAEDAKLKELISAKNWVALSTAFPSRLGSPLTVWAPADGKGADVDAQINDAATLLLTDPETGSASVTIHGLAVVTAAEGSVMAQTVRNMLLFIHDVRSHVLVEGANTGDAGSRAEAVENAVATWPTYVRRVTDHCRAKLLLDPQLPALPQFAQDGTLREQ